MFHLRGRVSVLCSKTVADREKSNKEKHARDANGEVMVAFAIVNKEPCEMVI